MQSKYLVLLSGLVCAQPLLVLVIAGWSSGILILGGLACLVVVLMSRYRHFFTPEALPKGYDFYLFLLAYSLFFILIFFSELLRSNFHFAVLDSPVRFLLAIPIFLLIRRIHFDITRTLMLFISLGLIVTLIDQLFFPSEHPWHLTRMSTHFADPLAFGYISLAFALTSLVSLICSKPQSIVLVALKLVAFCAGIYMSVMTESRSGWLAIPLVLIFLLYVKRKQLSFKSFAFCLLVLAGAAIVTYNSVEKVRSRIDAGMNELSSYSFQGVAPDTSIGMRITFLRIAYDMVSERPLTGYGNTHLNKPEIPKTVTTYASPFTIDFALSSGFHNEIITNAVQYGLWSAFAASLLFLVPLGIYWQGLKRQSIITQHAAAVGIAFTLTYFVSSLSTEVFGLKYTASLYALITAVLCAATTRNNTEAS